jgi:hypothetical protein
MHMVYRGPKLSHVVIMFLVERSFTESPKGSNSIEHQLSVVKRWTDKRFSIVSGVTKTLLRYNGTGRDVSPTEVTGREDPFLTMIDEGSLI